MDPRLLYIPPTRLVALDSRQALDRVRYGAGPTPFGDAVLVWCEQGIVALWLATRDAGAALSFVQKRHEVNAGMSGGSDLLVDGWGRDDANAAQRLAEMFDACAASRQTIPVLVRASPFELQVWTALCDIPSGKTLTYTELAHSIGRPEAVRAVGSAVGRNGVAWLIPCHRVIPKSGGVGQFRWGSELKQKLLRWEAGR